jgi:hypothetical protein
MGVTTSAGTIHITHDERAVKPCTYTCVDRSLRYFSMRAAHVNEQHLYLCVYRGEGSTSYKYQNEKAYRHTHTQDTIRTAARTLTLTLIHTPAGPRPRHQPFHSRIILQTLQVHTA